MRLLDLFALTKRFLCRSFLLIFLFLMSRILQSILLLLPTFWLSAQMTITGRVVNESGETLIGVNVVASQSGRGTITDLNGEYEITVPDNEKALAFTYIGMEKRVAIINNRRVINVTLKESSEILDEVVITAYRGGVEEKDLVGSYSQATQEDLETDRPVESLDQLLEGKVAGVQVESISGEPGLPVKVRIRGEGSLVRPGGADVVASAQPLYVIDGVPLFDVLELNPNRNEFNTLNPEPLNPLAMLNPEDIETITVLKDAAATSIYGANAGNGVILITTKKGRAGSHTINVSTTLGFAEEINDVKLLSSPEYVQLFREQLFNSGEDPSQAGSPDLFTDWRGLAQQQGFNTQTNLSFSGGTEKSTYRLSLGYYYLQSIAKRNDIARYSANLSLQQNFSEHVNLSTALNFSRLDKEAINTFNPRGFPPNLSPFLDNGQLNEEGFFATRPNPVSVLRQNENSYDNYDVNGRTTLTVKAYPWLKLTSLFGVNLYTNRQRLFQSGQNASGRNRDGYLSINNDENFRWIWSNRVSGDLPLKGMHRMSYIGGFEVQDRRNLNARSIGQGFISEDLREISFASERDARSSSFRDALVSGFADISYNYDYRYYASISWRRDASSLFGGDVRNADFGAIGLSWIFSEELFWNLDRITLGKVRASFGTSGNARIGTYAAQGTYSLGINNQYGGVIGAFPANAANPDLGWESTTKWNLGLDLEWNNNIKLTTELYSNTVNNAISSVSIPAESGFNTVIFNNGSMRNWGMEFTLSGQVIQNESWRWTTNFNAAFNRNKVLSVPVERIQSLSAVGIREGEDVNTLYGVKYAGVDPYNGEPLYQLSSGEITDDRDLAYDIDNRQPIGRSAPLIAGGLTNAVQWKNFSLSVFLNYSYGGDFLISEFYISDGRQIAFLNQSVNQLDRWQQAGDITYVPRLDINNPFQRTSTRLLFDNDFIELNNVRFSYTPFRQKNGPVYLKSLELSLQVNRLGIWYFSKTKADRNGPKEYRFEFPRQRNYSFSLKTRF